MLTPHYRVKYTWIPGDCQWETFESSDSNYAWLWCSHGEFPCWFYREKSFLFPIITHGKDVPTAGKYLPTIGKYLPTARKYLPTVGKYFPTAGKYLPTGQGVLKLPFTSCPVRIFRIKWWLVSSCSSAAKMRNDHQLKKFNNKHFDYLQYRSPQYLILCLLFGSMISVEILSKIGYIVIMKNQQTGGKIMRKIVLLILLVLFIFSFLGFFTGYPKYTGNR